MKRGPNIPVEQRDEWARNAAEIASQGRKSDALRVLAKMYGVTQSTARNLISRGNYLAAIANRTGGGGAEG